MLEPSVDELKAAVTQNTEALNKLISLLANMPLVIPGAPAPADTVKADTKPAAEKPDEQAGAAETLSYKEDVRKPFLALLNSKREVALALLKDLGVASLQGFETQPEKFAELNQKIKEAQNG